jgi:hypothetical protein
MQWAQKAPSKMFLLALPPGRRSAFRCFARRFAGNVLCQVYDLRSVGRYTKAPEKPANLFKAEQETKAKARPKGRRLVFSLAVP